MIGKFKDELKRVLLEEFVVLRPKLYSLLYAREKNFATSGEGEEREVEKPTATSSKKIVAMEEKEIAKGIKESVKKDQLKPSYYHDTLFSSGEYVVSQNLLRSQNHVVTSRNIEKVALTGYDTKRWLLDDGISTREYGHHLNVM